MAYMLEYAKSDRSSCNGPEKICPTQDRSIGKGELRLGVEIARIHGITWRHWSCTTAKVISNMQSAVSDPSEIAGWDELRDDDKERVQRAWDEGEIPKNELPEPATDHVKPVSKRKNSVELPATNEIAAAKEVKNKKAKTTDEEADTPEAPKMDNGKELTPEPAEQESSKSAKKESKVKKEDPKVTINDPKAKPVPEEPKVAKYASRNKTVKDPKKSRGEPTRRSARIPMMKKEESDNNDTSALSSAQKRKSGTADAATKKAKKD